jgi:transcriptional regulator with XRE-family HTH domain
MKKKIQNKFVDYGCGFPVLLRHVPMVEYQGMWTPCINYNELEKAVLLMLCYKPTKLTGNEIRFIRLYFEMTLQIFAKRFGVRHPTVIKWENFKDDPTNMMLGTEKDIRLFVISQLVGQKKIGELYVKLEQFPPSSDFLEELLEVDLKKLAI